MPSFQSWKKWAQENPQATQIGLNTLIVLTVAATVVPIVAYLFHSTTTPEKLRDEITNNPTIKDSMSHLREAFSQEQVDAIFALLIAAGVSILKPLNKTLFDTSRRIIVSITTNLGINWLSHQAKYGIDYLRGRGEASNKTPRFIQNHPSATKITLGVALPIAVFFATIYPIFFARSEAGSAKELENAIKSDNAFKTATETLKENFDNQTVEALVNAILTAAASAVPFLKDIASQMFDSLLYNGLVTALYFGISSLTKEGLALYKESDRAPSFFKKHPKFVGCIFYASLFLIAAGCAIAIAIAIEDIAKNGLTGERLVESIMKNPAFTQAIENLPFDTAQKAAVQNAILATAAETMRPIKKGVQSIINKMITAVFAVIGTKFITDAADTFTTSKRLGEAASLVAPQP